MSHAMSIAVRIAAVVSIIALALWVGSMAGFAFLFAPMAFSHLGPTAQFATLIGDSIIRLDAFGNVCALISAASLCILIFYNRRSALSILGCIALMYVLSAYEVDSILPGMRALQTQTPAYEALHRRSQEVYGSVLLLGIAALAILAARRTS